MPTLIQKIKRHGIKDSLTIVRRKILLVYRKGLISSGRYNFYSDKELLGTSAEKLSAFLESVGSFKYCSFHDKAETEESGIFFLLGRNYKFKERINWHFNSDDPAGKSYPNIFSGSIPIEDQKNFGDYRITWELNRHHHFVWLAQDYFLKKEEKYPELFLQQINSWIDENQPGSGINFVSPMEISIRLINWLTAFIIFKSSGKNLASAGIIINSILGQLLYLGDNLFIKREFRNNHSIVELAGLIIFQSILKWKKLPEVNKLYETLFEEIDQQFYDDGINFEHSPTYARFTLESLLALLIFARNNELKNENSILLNLTRKYTGSLRKFITPMNSVPLLSDNDNGRILFLSGSRKDFNNFKGFFDFCGSFFKDDSLFISDSAETFNYETKWWCNLAGIDAQNPPYSKSSPAKEAKYFPEGGYYIFNSGKVFFLFKSNYPGNKNLNFEYAPHVHNDLLSFELYFSDEPLLVDSGTYTYNAADNSYRDYFRSIYAHNTIIVNGKPQFDYIGSFGAKNFPGVIIKEIDDNTVSGELKFNNNLTLMRQIKIDGEKIEFHDHFHGLAEDDRVEINFNFHPLIKISSIDHIKKITEIKGRNNKYVLKVEDAPKHALEIRKDKGWVSEYYNVKEENEQLTICLFHVKEKAILHWHLQKL